MGFIILTYLLDGKKRGHEVNKQAVLWLGDISLYSGEEILQTSRALGHRG